MKAVAQHAATLRCPGDRTARSGLEVEQQRQEDQRRQHAPADEAPCDHGVDGVHQFDAEVDVIGDLVQVGLAERTMDPVAEAKQKERQQIQAAA